MRRTGTYQYVRHHRVMEFLKRGWMVIDDLSGTHHGFYSVLMWRCDCGVAE